MEWLKLRVAIKNLEVLMSDLADDGAELAAAERVLLG